MTFVQVGSSSSTSAFFPGNVTTGNLLVVGYINSNGAVSSVSDTQGNTWTLAQAGSSSGPQVPWIWYAVAKSTAACTVTVVDSGTNEGMVVAEYNGPTQLGTNASIQDLTIGQTAISAGPSNTTLGSIIFFGTFSTGGAYTSTSGSTGRVITTTNRLRLSDNLTATGAYTETGSFASSFAFVMPTLVLNFGANPSSGGGVTTTRSGAPTPSTICAANGATFPITSPTLGVKLGQPVPVVFTDANGNELAVTGSSKTGNAGSPTPVVLCDGIGHPLVAPIVFTSNSNTLTVSSTKTGTKLGQPVPVVATDQNGFFYALAGFTLGSMAGNPTPIVLTDANGNVLALSGIAT